MAPILPTIQTLEQVLEGMQEEALHRVIGGEPLTSFCDWFVAQLQPAFERASTTEQGADPRHSRRLLLTMARHFWRDVPMPGNRWRTQSLPKIERNDRCYCGSGRKYKQCCADLADMPPILHPDHALGLVLASMAPDQLSVAALRQVPPAALALAAMAIRDDHGDARAAALLEPLFIDPVGLDARHDDAFDVLMDALLSLGQEARRAQVMQAVSQSTDKALATSARCRRVSMLVDRGEYAQAWTLFHEAQRLSPDDPQLLHLEMLTLLGEGRVQEARDRAPMLAARARKLGYPDLAQVLVELSQDGLAAAANLSRDDETLDDEERSWVDLLRAAPAALDAAHCHGLYTLQQLPALDGQSEPVLDLLAGKALQRIDKRWRKAFPVSPPMLTELEADADAILDDPRGVLDFLRKYPDAWCSVPVLDDLLLAARAMVDMSDAWALLSAARGLAAHAVAVCRAVVADAPGQVIWLMPRSRPFLRVIAQAIALARDARDNANADAWMRWSLALNPADNHGWREPVVERALESGDAGDALAWLDRYPDDRPPAGHQRALAQFMRGDVAAAEATLRAAHAQAPAMVAALLPDLLDAPPLGDGPGIAIGGAEHAYDYRGTMRPVWVRTGALTWLQGLDLPAPSPRRRAKTRVAAKKSAAQPRPDPATRAMVPQSRAKPLTRKQEQGLRDWFPDMPRLRGYVTAIAWSPGMVMPSDWMAPLMQMLQQAQDDGKARAPTLERMNTVLTDLLQLYNGLTGEVLAHDPDRLPDALPAGDDVFAWAAGFVQAAELCAGHWRGAGVAVNSQQLPFKSLFALAAQAAAGPDAWRATGADGQALLTGVDADLPPPGQVLLQALTPLWRVSASLRQQRG